jgi:hypothetical protein
MLGLGGAQERDAGRREPGAGQEVRFAPTAVPIAPGMNGAEYVRVSSKGQNLAMQRHAIEQEAARRGDSTPTTFARRSRASRGPSSAAS